MKKLTNKILPEKAITFDDVLLLPGYSDFKRKDVDLTIKLHKNITLKLPVISAPMDTVTEAKMAEALAQNGALGIIHRNLSVKEQMEMIKNVKKAKIIDKTRAAIDSKGRLLVGVAVGANSDLDKNIVLLEKAGVNLIVLDSANGFNKYIIEALKKIKSLTKIPVMAGNVATYDGAKALIDAGAEMLRIGMGPGSICTTRIVTGMGVPQITAVSEAVRAAEGTDVAVIADGGIKQIGDMAKALGFGARAVMLGSMLAGFEESPGDVIMANSIKFKQYRGMGSIPAMKRGSAERYDQSDNRKLTAEGVEGVVKYKGRVEEFLYQIDGGLRASFYDIGGKNPEEFYQKAQFVEISNNGLRESHPHDITITDSGGSYFV
ncbi:MAG: IMP dehydrogenase [Patescibacteria group bacterium]|nr:IMP dehydrogenase [Patescibacteria group bacterium]